MSLTHPCGMTYQWDDDTLEEGDKSGGKSSGEWHVSVGGVIGQWGWHLGGGVSDFPRLDQEWGGWQAVWGKAKVSWSTRSSNNIRTLKRSSLPALAVVVLFGRIHPLRVKLREREGFGLNSTFDLSPAVLECQMTQKSCLVKTCQSWLPFKSLDLLLEHFVVPTRHRTAGKCFEHLGFLLCFGNFPRIFKRAAWACSMRSALTAITLVYVCMYV